jgi:hypothetical protein
METNNKFVTINENDWMVMKYVLENEIKNFYSKNNWQYDDFRPMFNDLERIVLHIESKFRY